MATGGGRANATSTQMIGTPQMAQTKKEHAMAVGSIMSSTLRLTGEPIIRILCKQTDNLVGFLYQWNNGDLQPAWLNGAMAEVRYEPMVDTA
jgi:hypothetical protein